MKTTNPSHMPYKELPHEAARLFFIFALGASSRYQCYPPKRSELANALETVRNDEGLTEQDLSDPNRVTRLIEEHLASSTAGAAKAPSKKGAQ
jgi:hypothetical protein